MEWIKLRSIRSTWWLAIAAVLAMVATGVGVGLGYRGHQPVATAAQIVDNSLGGSVLAQLFLGALGVLVVTSEYSSGTIRATFAAEPRRSAVLTAKVAVFGGTALVVGLVASVAGYVAGQLAITGSAVPHASLGDPLVLRATVLTGVYLGLTGVLGLALGAIVHHSGGAIGALYGGLFVPMILVGVIGAGSYAVGRFVPNLMLLNSISVTTAVPGMFTAWLATLVMAGYAVIGLGLAVLLLTRRDV
jgi:ABC-type transport system involved in multi-copper enzyme maturation permease subunit